MSAPSEPGDAGPSGGPGEAAVGPPPADRGGPVRFVVREVGLAMITAGVVVLAFVVYQLWGTSFTEQADQSHLARAFAQAVAHDAPSGSAGAKGGTGGSDGATVRGGNATSLSPSTPTGVAVAHIVIPKIGVDKFVVQGTGDPQLSEGPGHYIGTPMPGQPGNVGIAGHRTTYGAPFFDLDQLTAGDPIYISVPSGRTFKYEVTGSQVVSPSDVTVLDATSRPTLTLTTCTPRFTATSRLVVTALLVGAPVSASAPASTPSTTTTTPVTTPASTGATTTSVPATTTTTQPAALAASGLASGDSGAWPPTLVWGAVFLVAWILTRVLTARARRWRAAGVLLVGIVVSAVPLWFCFENVVRLLPASV